MKVFLIIALVSTVWISCEAQCKEGSYDEAILTLKKSMDILADGIKTNKLNAKIEDLSTQLKKQSLQINGEFDDLKETLLRSPCSREPRCGDTPNSLILPDLGCLKLIHITMNWNESRLHCETLGMRLAENIPRKHYTTIWDAFSQYKYDTWWGVYMWVGGFGRHWISTGKNITQDLFKTGEPSALSFNTYSSCIDLSLRGSNDTNNEGLYDDFCSDRYYPLCQLPLS